MNTAPVCKVTRADLSTEVSTPTLFSSRVQGYRVRNLDEAIVIYAGFEGGLTVDNGFPIQPGECQEFNTTSGLFLVAASGTPQAAILTFLA